MARYTNWAAALSLVVVAACASKPVPVVVNPAPPPPPSLSQGDQTFAQTAAASDAFEIQSSQIAADKSHRAAIKEYAQQMVQAHTQSTQQLIQILQAKGITPPPVQLTPEQQNCLAKLKAAHGPAFDSLYLHAQWMAHEGALQATKQEAASGQDDAVKAFAQQLVGVIQQHLDEVHHLKGDRHETKGVVHAHAHHHHHHNVAAAKKSADQ
jgi:putative membrane protein